MKSTIVVGDVYLGDSVSTACPYILICENGLCSWATSVKHAQEKFDRGHIGFWQDYDGVVGKFVTNVAPPFWLSLKHKQ